MTAKTLVPLEIPRVSRTTLALYAGASNDHMPLHIDIDAARDAGMDDVFCHGMLSMAYLGRLLTDNFAQERLRSFEVRFTAITPVNAEPVVTGEVAVDPAGASNVTLALALSDGTVTVTGTAVVAPEGAIS